MEPRVTRYELDDPELLELVSPEMDRWLDSWSAEEQARYGGQYVAVSREKRVVAADKSAAGLQRKLDEMGLEKVLVFYMEPSDAYIIYSLCP